MRELIRLLGLLMVCQGVSGAIDHLGVQPFMGAFLNLFNRVIVSRLDFLAGYELFANLLLAALGAILLVTAGRTQPS